MDSDAPQAVHFTIPTDEQRVRDAEALERLNDGDFVPRIPASAETDHGWSILSSLKHAAQVVSSALGYSVDNSTRMDKRIQRRDAREKREDEDFEEDCSDDDEEEDDDEDEDWEEDDEESLSEAYSDGLLVLFKNDLLPASVSFDALKMVVLSEVSLDILALLARAPNVSDLSIRRTRCGEDVVLHLAGRLRRLDRLVLDQCEIESAACLGAALASPSCRVAVLELPNNLIADLVALLHGAERNRGSLVELSIRSNSFLPLRRNFWDPPPAKDVVLEDLATAAVASLIRNTRSLRVLNLSETGLVEDERFQKALLTALCDNASITSLGLHMEPSELGALLERNKALRANALLKARILLLCHRRKDPENALFNMIPRQIVQHIAKEMFKLRRPEDDV